MSELKLITDRLLSDLSAEASASPRLRKNFNLHPALADPVQRLCNAFEPGTYVRPHRHLQADRWELFVVLSGVAAVLLFDDTGTVRERVDLDAGGEVRGVEVPPATWHTMVSLKSGTVLFEVKPGPYVQTSDKDFADWAPPEGDARCAEFENWYREAQQGDGPPALAASRGRSR